ncbi:hypothetical protein DV738_g1708, partial [Chaetothyriales sp. CBS 135597]
MDSGSAATTTASQAAQNKASPAADPVSVSPWTRIQNSLLHFLSHASNETLGACAVGLAASTYLILGRIGLILIGAVGGIALHARWDSLGRPNAQGIGEEGQRRRNELGIEVAKRALEWRDIKRGARQTDQSHADYNGYDDGNANANANADTDAVALSSRSSTDTKPPADLLSDFPPETQDAVNKFIDAIIRDYVKWWYHPLLPADHSFPEACRQTLAKLIVTFSSHLVRKRTADPVLDFFANSTSIIIVFLNELSTALKTSPRQDPADAIRTYLQHQPESSLANVLNRDQQDSKLNIIAEDLLNNFLDPPAYNCVPVKTFLREVLSGLILKPMIDAQARADSINGWIVYLLEDGESELMNAIDAGVDGAAAKLKDAADKPTSHRRRLSRAEEAMEDAMKEVERMNAMIAEEEEARRQKGSGAASDHRHTPSSAASLSAEAVPNTPTSSDSEQNRSTTRSRSVSYLLDAEGNAITSPLASPTKQSIDLITSQLPLPARSEENLLPQQSVDTQSPPLEAPAAIPLTLHRAFITIMDLGDGDENVIMKKEPTYIDFLVQIEPASSRFPGWMVMKRYADFVKLHDRLMTYARVGVPQFTVQNSEVPSWRGIARRTLCTDLEFYLRNALKYEGLAESEAMKKFLEKETGLAKAAPLTKNVLVQGGAALENVGKNFVNVLGQGGKGIAGGGKVVIGGVQGAFGAITAGTKKLAPLQQQQQKPATTQDPIKVNATPAAPSSVGGSDAEAPSSLSNRPSSDQDESPVLISDEEILHLPPRPSETSDDYDTETRVLVELMFAIITELYSLSPSAWTIRLSLLSAAKAFLLRPQNPQLDSIRILVQESVLDSNFSDKGIAAHINRLRRTVTGPYDPSQKLRLKARKLLVERGMPQALTSVMGQQASGEALGKVFDCLQIQDVSRGFVFALLLQALRAASQ